METNTYPHRSWFPYILIGLSVALFVIIFAVRSNVDTSSKQDAATPATVVVPTNAEYEAGVKAILSAYSADQNASTAYAALIKAVVPQVSYQTAHLDLVIAFAQLQAGQAVEGKTRLDLARATYAWLK
jgi:hypothetical protein